MLKRNRTLKKWICSLSGIAMLSTSFGCSRPFWRKQADADAYQAITEHLTDTRWAVPRIDVTPDPRSRFYSPYDPDCAPLPPDDPAAHVYMHWVDGWEGYKCWHQFGDMMSVENPQWLANFGLTPEMIDEQTGEYIAPVPKMEDVTLQQAVELAQIHDRDYQTEIENLFLVALNVTLQRYRLGVIYLEPTVTGDIDWREGGNNDGASLGARNIGVRQMLPWGTNIAVNMANSIVWQFGPGGGNASLSALSFSIVQPLLRDAGRKVNLENLTQSERDLLYQARDLARFRKILFTDVVSQYLGLIQQVQSIKNQQGNIMRLREQTERQLAANAPESFSVNVDVTNVDGAGVRTLPPFYNQFENNANNPDAPKFPIPEELQGKLDYRLRRLIWRGLMSEQQEQILRNISPSPEFQEDIDSLVASLPSAAAGLDALNLQSALQSAINSLRSAEVRLQDRLDQFKISLGLPPDMVLTIDDSMLKPFEIIAPVLTEQEQIVEDFAVELYRGDSSEVEVLAQLGRELAKVLEDIDQQVVESIHTDLTKFEAVLPQRLQQLAEETAKNQLQADFNQANDRFRNFLNKFKVIQQDVASVVKDIQSGGLSDEDRLTKLVQLRTLSQDLLLLVQSGSVIQASSRLELISIPDFDMSLEIATKIAVEQRLDLMNAKAEVMDARRAVEIAANDLRAKLDIGVSGSLDDSDDAADLSAFLEIDGPLDQQAERNAYRRALVLYDRARRNYMLAEDRVKSDVRFAWRQLSVLKKNLETSRAAVRIAALQYEAAASEVLAPPNPNQNQSRATGNQGTQLTNALNGLLRTQEGLISDYLDFERNRLNIYRDMGIMEIGPDGIWNDEVYRKLDMTNESNNDDAAFWQSEDMGFATTDSSLSGGSRLRNEDDRTGVVELDHLFGRLQKDPQGFAND